MVQQHITVSILWTWIQLLLWEPWAELTFPRQRWGWGPSKCQGPAHRPICDHILSMTSFKNLWNSNQNNHKALSFSWACFNQRTWGLHNLGREIHNLLSRSRSVEFPAHLLFYAFIPIQVLPLLTVFRFVKDQISECPRWWKDLAWMPLRKKIVNMPKSL